MADDTLAGSESERFDASIRVGVSSCLLGEKVRYDGGHKRDRFVTDELARAVSFVPSCPEVACGMGIPRPTVRLERRGAAVHMVDPRDGRDHTGAMLAYARRRVSELSALNLDGYILKARSPSCGMALVPVMDAHGMTERNGRGLFAAALMELLPRLPVEEEGHLCDWRLRENFVERIFAYRRLKSLFGARWTLGELVAFHSAHKLQLLAHAPQAYRELGRLVAAGREYARVHGRAALREVYETGFMDALAKLATPGRNTNVLQHMAGYFRRDLDADSREELAGLIDAYRSGFTPLLVPLSLIRHHAWRLGVDYLQEQTYLEPHPSELMLRNQI